MFFGRRPVHFNRLTFSPRSVGRPSKCKDIPLSFLITRGRVISINHISFVDDVSPRRVKVTHIVISQTDDKTENCSCNVVSLDFPQPRVVTLFASRLHLATPNNHNDFQAKFFHNSSIKRTISVKFWVLCCCYLTAISPEVRWQFLILFSSLITEKSNCTRNHVYCHGNRRFHRFRS